VTAASATQRSNDGALVVAVFVAFGAGLALWAAGTVSGRLWGGAWPEAGAGQAGAILAGLIRNPGEPALAWPPADAALIPGPWAFYPVLALLLAVGAGVAGGLRRVFGPKRRGDGAAWAEARDLRSLVVVEPECGRLVLGYSGRRLLATESRHSVCVMGPTQTNKTTGFAVPAILEWQGPVLATSVKDDLVADTLGWRSTRGNVWLYDPTNTTGRPSAGWTPLSGVEDWAGARRVAAWLVSAAETPGGVEDADFWHRAATKLIAPYLLAARLAETDMAQVVEWIETQEVAEVAEILGARGPRAALRAAHANWRREEKQRSSIFTTTEILLDAYADPVVAASAERSDIHPDLLFDGGAHTLYISAPGDDQDQLRPLFGALVHQVLAAVGRRAIGRRPIDPPLLVVLDEAANIAPLRNLDYLASTAAGMGVQLVTVWQDLAQIEARYGKRAQTIVNNHRAKVLLSGISDPSALDYVSRLSGDEEVMRDSTTRDASGLRSSTESTTYRRLAPADALRRVVPGEGVLLYGHLPPAQLRLRPWFDDAALCQRAKTVVGERAGDSAKPLLGRAAEAGS
jgi:type IV secretion system protein VirD4